MSGIMFPLLCLAEGVRGDLVGQVEELLQGFALGCIVLFS